MNLQGRSAFITGGGTGVGEGIAHCFAREGCRVVISGRRQETLERAARGYKGEPKILTRVLDIADRAAVDAAVSWATEELGKIDILVNSAGTNIPNRSMRVIDPDDWDMMLRVNATGAFNCMHAVLPQMRKRSDGLIINISSIAGKRATLLGGVSYNAGKFAMSALGTSVGLEEAQNGIRVTNIYPGEVNTPLLELRPVKVSDEHKARILQPEDVAAAALMVALLPPRANIPELIIKPTTQEYA